MGSFSSLGKNQPSSSDPVPAAIHHMETWPYQFESIRSFTKIAIRQPIRLDEYVCYKRYKYMKCVYVSSNICIICAITRHISYVTEYVELCISPCTHSTRPAFSNIAYILTATSSLKVWTQKKKTQDANFSLATWWFHTLDGKKQRKNTRHVAPTATKLLRCCHRTHDLSYGH